jgi:hypothetical protein
MAAEAIADLLGREPPPPVPVPQPLLDSAGVDAGRARIFAASWRAGDLWALEGYRLATGEAPLPGTGFVELAAEAFRQADRGYALHPALMDIATGWAMRLIPCWGAERLWVPLGHARIRVLAPLPAEIASHVRASCA